MRKLQVANGIARKLAQTDQQAKLKFGARCTLFEMRSSCVLRA